MSLINFKRRELRQHLADCFSKGELTPFPRETSRPASQKQTYEIDIYCECELPEVYDNMVQCDGCDKWFHLRCMGLIEYNLSQKWYCKQCAS